MSRVRTPKCPTPPLGSPRLPSPGRQGSGNGERPLVKKADTTSPSSHPPCAPRTQGPQQSPGTHPPSAQCLCPPCRHPPTRPCAPLPFPPSPLSPQREWLAAWGPQVAGLRRHHRGEGSHHRGRGQGPTSLPAPAPTAGPPHNGASPQLGLLEGRGKGAKGVRVIRRGRGPVGQEGVVGHPCRPTPPP